MKYFYLDQADFNNDIALTLHRAIECALGVAREANLLWT